MAIGKSSSGMSGNMSQQVFNEAAKIMGMVGTSPQIFKTPMDFYAYGDAFTPSFSAMIAAFDKEQNALKAKKKLLLLL